MLYYCIREKRITTNLMNKDLKIKSPCTGDCKYDENKVCVSCRRTMYEIVNWIDFSDEEKLQVLRRIEKKTKK